MAKAASRPARSTSPLRRRSSRRTSPRSRRCSREHNAVVFKVAGDATKPQIKAAVEALFNVSVTGVNTIVRRARPSAGRAVPTRARTSRRLIVTLAEGQSIDITERDLRPMALKQYNPTSPAAARPDPRRQVVAVEGQAGQGADRRQAQDRRPQQQGPCHLARHRRRSQAEVPLRRLQASQVGHAGDRRAARVRPEPHRVHRAGQVRGRRARLHPRAAAPRRRRHGRSPARRST